MDDANPTGAVDEDRPHLWAEGANVGVVWIDDRVSVNGGMGSNNAFQNTYLRYSTDNGVTFQPEVDCTQLTVAGGFSYRQPLVKIYGDMFFVGCGMAGFQSLNGSLVLAIADMEYHGRVQSLIMLSFSFFGLAAFPFGILADAIGLFATSSEHDDRQRVVFT